MRVFITGGTGYIGGAVAASLSRAGHEVTALVRTDSETRALRDLGVVLLAGDLESLPSLEDQLGNYDTFVHAAVSAQERAGADKRAVDTFTALDKPIVYTSGVWVLGNTKAADESSPVNPLPIVAWRPSHEERVLAAGGAVVRPGVVYGGKQSIAAAWFGAAEQNGPLQIVGDGRNHWAWVDIHELADLYLRAVEQRARGVLHGMDDTQATVEECARAVAPKGTIEKIPLEAAREHMGPYADALAVDQHISSRATREKLGWAPKRTFTGSVDAQWREWRAAQR
jgi:nucleoside-diphosphate-sugar epimerase